jgi:2-methylisocitrate lyase-like PEP mutase family enzyme
VSTPISPAGASRADKGARFGALHERPGAFVMPNPWDPGSARVLESLGFEALATSSGASANVLGRGDGQVTRDEALAHAGAIVAAVAVPVSGDLEKGFGDDPATVAETVRLAAGVGLAGCSIEDATGRHDEPIFPFESAVARVRAAAEAARALPFPFTLTARSENFLRNRLDLDDTIARLRAFEEAGADVLFAPGLPDLDAVRKVCAAVRKPVNFMVAIPGRSFSVAELEAAGVRRISVATSFYRAAMSGLVEAATEVKEKGTFGYLERLVPSRRIAELLQR